MSKAASTQTNPTLDRIEQAYELFAGQRDGVLKVAITHGA